MSEQKSPSTTIVTIGTYGVYNMQLKCYYWALWMDKKRGLRTYVLGDLFTNDKVHVFDAESDKYLGEASVASWPKWVTETDIKKKLKLSIKAGRAACHA
jgi:hypothetical protein